MMNTITINQSTKSSQRKTVVANGMLLLIADCWFLLLRFDKMAAYTSQ